MSNSSDRIAVRTLAATYPAGFRLHEHGHRWGQLLFTMSGVLRVSSERALWVVPPTRALWVPAGATHGIVMQGKVAMRTLYLEPTRAMQLPRSVHVLEVVPLLRELILHILDIGMLVDIHDVHERLSGVLTDLILAARCEDFMLPMPNDSRARHVAEHWRNQPGDQHALSELAAQAGASLRTLQRLFPHETGLTLEAWRQKARLIHAAGLLGAGLRVTDAALEVGYESLAAFGTAFTRQFGVSPGQFARAAVENGVSVKSADFA